MYKVMVVDDEKYIRKSIINRVDWQQFGLTVEAEAGNGMEALDMLETVRPEVILVDIRMPRMDGLEFIAEAKKRFPRSSYVIMSAYNDFSYAKKAIQLGVEDYILKPVEEEELGKILENIVYRLNEERLVKQLLRGKNGQSGLPFRGKNMMALAFYMEDDEDLEERIKNEVKKELSRMMPEAAVYYLKDYSRSDCYVFLINGSQLSEVFGEQFMEQIWLEFDAWEGAAACSGPLPNSRVNDAVAQCMNLLKRKIFCPERKIVPPACNVKRGAAKEPENAGSGLTALYQYILEQDYGRLVSKLREAIGTVIREENGTDTIEAFINEVLALLKHIPKEQHDSIDLDIIFHEFNSRDYLLAYKSSEKLKEDLYYAVGQTINTTCTDDQDVIFEIKTYIQDHYADNLNAAEIAQKFFLNASYLSTLFKEKTGLNLTAYVEGIRMEKAKHLLEKSSQSVTDVAIAAGYSDSSYFSKVFKRYSGMTPRQYRDNL